MSACHWVRWEHRVTVLTCAPNFPEGKVFEGYRNRWHQVEEMSGIRVVPVRTYIARQRALAAQLDVEGSAPAAGEKPVLNIQLEAAGRTYRDYYVDLDFTGPKTVILAEPGASRMLAEFRPALANYCFKVAMYGFNYPQLKTGENKLTLKAAGSGTVVLTTITLGK
jgi:hypothetical protein